MAAPAWNSDPAGAAPQINENAQGVLRQIAADAPARRAPTLRQASRWHQALYANVVIPSPSYLGNPRDSDPAHPDLIDYEVRIGAKHGVPAARVPDELGVFINTVRAAVRTFDAAFPFGAPPATEAEVASVASLAAQIHGEWIRIHPYANGNGRTARLWANWAALRYALPPFVRVKPRPASTLYEAAAERSMGSPPLFVGDHTATVAVFVDMLRESLQ